MIPSVIASQLKQGVDDFLRTTFPISTPLFHGLVEDLLNQKGSIFKGPYVSINLPFRNTSFYSYCHRNRIWKDRVFFVSDYGLLL